MKITITERDEQIRRELFEHIAEVYDKFGMGRCDGTLKLTKRFVKKHTSNRDEFKKLISLIRNSGGYCDCEVLMNVYKPWEVGTEVEVDDETANMQ